MVPQILLKKLQFETSKAGDTLFGKVGFHVSLLRQQDGVGLSIFWGGEVTNHAV